MSTNIYDIANQLERAIRQLPEYKAVEDIRAAIEKDSLAKPILDEQIAFQKELQVLMQTGQMTDKTVHEKMQALNEKIQGNALLTDYFTKQQQLSIYIADLEKIIFKPLQDLL